MRQLLVGATLTVAFALLGCWPSFAQQTKTAAQCNADYAANKPAIQAAKVKKKDFVASCRAGNEVIPGAAAAPAPAAPPIAAAPAPVAPAKPAAPANTGFFGRKKASPVARTPSTGAPIAANQFASQAQAEGRCPGATVVWVNTKSGVYHFAGSRNFGTTKAGAYMCEADATAAGDRASKTEKHP